MGGFRLCRKEDFTSKKYDTTLPSDYSNYICLEYEKIRNHFTLKDKYLTSKKNELHSIHLEINKCHTDCESDENIKKFLGATWINVYNLIE